MADFFFVPLFSASGQPSPSKLMDVEKIAERERGFFARGISHTFHLPLFSSSPAMQKIIPFATGIQSVRAEDKPTVSMRAKKG